AAVAGLECEVRVRKVDPARTRQGLGDRIKSRLLHIVAFTVKMPGDADLRVCFGLPGLAPVEAAGEVDPHVGLAVDIVKVIALFDPCQVEPDQDLIAPLPESLVRGPAGELTFTGIDHAVL